MIIAPILGIAVDYAKRQSLGGEFWPVAAIAAIVAMVILLTPLKEKGNGKRADIKHECIEDIED